MREDKLGIKLTYDELYSIFSLQIMYIVYVLWVGIFIIFRRFFHIYDECIAMWPQS